MEEKISPTGWSSAVAQGIKLGIIVLLLFVGVFLAWLAFIDVKRASLVEGKLVFKGEDKVVQHLAGGRVAEIFVQEGDEVKKGEILILLDDTEALIQKKYLEEEIFYLQATEKRLIAQIHKHPRVLFNGISAEKMTTDEQNILIYQKKLFESSSAFLQNQIASLEDKIAKLRGNIKTTQKRLEKIQAQIELLNKEEKELVVLAEDQLVSKPRLWSVQREKERILESKIQNEGMIEELQEEIKQAFTQKEIILSQSSKEDLTSLVDVQAKLLEAQSTLGKINYRIENSQIAAPISGTVMNLSIHTVDGVVKGGEELMTIVPKTATIQIEGRLDPLDFKNISDGEKAYITLLPYNRNLVPQIEGKVVYLSPNIFVDPNTERGYYKVFIEFSMDELENYPEIKLYPGMPVDAMIVNKRGTILEYLTQPIRRSFDRAFREL